MNLEEIFKINILELPDVAKLPQGEKDKFLEWGVNQVFEGIAERIADTLPEEKKREFLRLFSEPASAEDRLRFLETEVPNFDMLLLEETLQLKEDLVGMKES